MLKWFAKYNKIILVVGGVLLMIVFLLPAGFQGMSQGDVSDEVVGRVGDVEFTVLDRRIADSEIALLSQMPMFSRGIPQDSLQWLLLQYEARQHGIYVSQAQGRQMAEMILNELPQLGPVLQRQNVSIDTFAQALAHLQMVVQLENMVVSAAHPSEPRLRHFAREIRSNVTLDAVPVDAAAMMDAVEEPTEQELQAHFDNYKDDAPGSTEPYGFGYRLPPRVKLEYISVPLQRVAASIDVDEVAAYRYYLEHPERFMPSPDASAQGEQATPPTNEPLPYEQVRQRVVDQLTQELAQQKQQEIVQELLAVFSGNTRRLKLDEQGYRVIEPPYEPIPLEDVAGQIQQRFGVLPNVVRIENDWLALSDIAGLQGFGDAAATVNGQSVPVSQYIASVKELGLNTSVAALKLQEDVVSRPVTDGSGTTYLFRVTDADPARSPQDLAEVREQVVENVKRLKAYGRLSERAAELAQRATAEGLPALAQSFNTTVTKFGPFSGRDLQAMMIMNRLELPRLPIVGQSQVFVNAAFDVAEEVREAGGLENATDAQKIAAVPVDSAQKVVVFKLTDYQPIDSQTFDRIKMQLPVLMAQAAAQESLGQQSPLSLDALIERTGFEYANPPEEPAEETAQG